MPPAVTVLLVRASVRPFDAMKGIFPLNANGKIPEHIPGATRCDASPPKCGRSDLLGPVAVGLSYDFHQVTVGVVEIDAPAAVQMIDLTPLGAPRIGVIPHTLSADARECRVELGVANEEGVMPRPELLAC